MVSAGPLFTRLDPLVVAVRDLDASTRAYGAMLGLAPSWQGSHPGLGTRNAYVVDDCDAAVARLRAESIAVSDARPGLATRTRVATVSWPDRLPTLLIQHLPR